MTHRHIGGQTQASGRALDDAIRGHRCVVSVECLGEGEDGSVVFVEEVELPMEEGDGPQGDDAGGLNGDLGGGDISAGGGDVIDEEGNIGVIHCVEPVFGNGDATNFRPWSGDRSGRVGLAGCEASIASS